MTNSLTSIRFLTTMSNVEFTILSLKIHQFSLEHFNHKKKTEVQDHEKKFDFYSTQVTHQMVLRQ